ncbi:hypothetical protein [Natronorubrum halalkaliphilum]
MATAAGIPTPSYAPYYLFGILSPVVLFAVALTGFGVPTLRRTETGRTAD